jgi:8-oxo-dGTP diphosphatase
VANKAVGILLIRKKDQAALLQLRDNKKNIIYPNRWGSPGGHVNKGESYLECARRELLEETGYLSKKLKYLKTFNQNYHNKIIKVKIFYDFFDSRKKFFCYEGKKIQFVNRKKAEKYKVINIVTESWDLILKNTQFKKNDLS